METGPLRKQLLLNIRSLRQLRGLSQAGLAERVGLTQTAYSRMESGRAKATFERLVAVAEALGVEVCDLIRYHESTPKGQSVGPEKSVKLKELEQKTKYLEEVNERMREHIRDKEEIIELLRSELGSRER